MENTEICLQPEMEINQLRAMAAYLREEMCGYMPLNCVTMRLEGLFIVEKQSKNPSHSKT